MDRHVEDTRYYRKRAGTTAKKGVTAELEAARERIGSYRRTEA
ncbi:MULTISPECIES: hypothetical protein [Halomicrobium]|uniref:Uncharacterized protein n=1 Tax=Halomicrobium mukohataei (strain ATCC 700874 / DSM 12286 / JCM 9738 / NCIMB 13541) TaxID=485914 RepID=C7P4M0_HALMD|nr:MULTISPECIES: hypothetical protein [Halomicrobium]ACV48042.1 hypothetical protein Hmuk_1929 [Halomicrobium mukohataei DSM 12286]